MKIENMNAAIIKMDNTDFKILPYFYSTVTAETVISAPIGKQKHPILEVAWSYCIYNENKSVYESKIKYTASVNKEGLNVDAATIENLIQSWQLFLTLFAQSQFYNSAHKENILPQISEQLQSELISTIINELNNF